MWRRVLVLLLLLLPGCGYGPFAGPQLTDQQAAAKVMESLGAFGNDFVKTVGVNVMWAGDGVWQVVGRFRFEAGKPEEEAMWLVDDRTGAVKSADDSATRVIAYAVEYNAGVAALRCPDGFPVKADPDTKQYQLPDHAEYGKTANRRVRCYATVQEAQAEGYSVATSSD